MTHVTPYIIHNTLTLTLAYLCMYIYRPATISGSITTGACNRSDTINRFLLTCAAVSGFPALPVGYKVSIVPVDYVAEVITTVAMEAG